MNTYFNIGDRFKLTFSRRGYSAYHGGGRAGTIVSKEGFWNGVKFDSCKNKECLERGKCNDFNALHHVLDRE